MKLKTLFARILLSFFSEKLFSLVAILIIILSSTVLLSQTSTKDYKFGAIPLTKEQYEKLPGPNWDTLKKYSNQSAFLAKSTLSVKMLVTPPIGDQGSESSCDGWCVGYTALGILTYPKYGCWDIAKRSPNYVYNQIKGAGDCTVGSNLTNALNLVKTQGSCSWSLMPYIDGNCTTLPNSTQIYDASKHNAISWSAIHPSSDVTQIKQALDLGLPVLVGFYVFQSFNAMWYSGGGIWTTPNSGYPLGYHAVCIVGYDDSQNMFKVQNSWGSGGGAQGFFWVTYDLVTSGVFNELFILAGLNANYPETLTGSTPVCSMGNGFLVNNLPSGCTVSWDKSSNLTLVQAIANSAIFAPNGSGSGWVKATVNLTTCTSFALPQYNVWVGTPVVSVSGPSSGCTNHTYYFTTNTDYYANASNFTWELIPLNGNYLSPYGYQNNSCAITFYNPYSASGYTVGARAQNSCGTGGYGTTSIYIHNCYYFSLSPNPASETVTVTKKVSGAADGIDNAAISEDATTIYTIRIIDFYGTLYYSAKKSGDSFTFPVSSLKDGQYIVQITDGKNPTNLTLIVKH